jgi:hypothetical protein
MITLGIVPLRRLVAFVCFAAVMTLSFSCSDPDKSVTKPTQDGAFALTMEAEKNWLRPGDSLPIRLKLVSLAGPLEETLSGRIDFLTNLGRLDVDYLDFTFTGTSDSLATVFETEFADWITFESFSSAGEEEQGEVHALYGDLQVTFKIRFVAAQ